MSTDHQNENPNIADTLFLAVGQPEIIARNLASSILLRKLYRSLIAKGLLTADEVRQTVSEGRAVLEDIAQELLDKDEPTEQLEETVATMRAVATQHFDNFEKRVFAEGSGDER